MNFKLVTFGQLFFLPTFDLNQPVKERGRGHSVCSMHGKYGGVARLRQMHCSDTTQTVKMVVGRRFKEILNVGANLTVMHRKLERPRI